ncbi:hypothetical protein Asppvi_001897 [Aspergillus pseudoviridinutans]|uniref:Transmembrane protein n=1 Tax=Aspergillus pseudoviridinutans TaxID=1517512 RepID=A0A9P3EY12_9EURO|nr:uncharacterized protein Asppvi_001897 [Aspergillus pseudoviridinutans]GIJ92619.1 hypothetical protein Asppvi_001897 [Aspergillus pseudoviridinutans]
MDHKADTWSCYRVPLIVNLLAAFCLAVLIALGVYVSKTPILVGGTSSPGFSVIKVDPNSWNVGCTVIGTAVGLLLSWGFSSYDELLTRKELQSPTGVLAMYLRPLSAMRGLHQLQRRRFPVTRSFLILASAISSLISATTVAVFGIHTDSVTVINPSASYSLNQLPKGGYVRNPDHSSYPIIVDADVSLLSSFLYRDAYIRSSQTMVSNIYLGRGNWQPVSGTLGSTTYPGLNTSGIGLNVTSYTQYSGPSSGFNLPTSYTFERLDAAVFGTIVEVTCVNATVSYSVSTTKYGDPQNPVVVMYNFAKNTVVNTTVLLNRDYALPFSIGSVVTEQNGEPLHTFLFPGDDVDQPFVLECTYGGNEILATISLSDRVSPLQVNRSVTHGFPLDATVKWQLSNLTDKYINLYSHSGPGGSLADGWVASEYSLRIYDGSSSLAAQTMGTILSELGQAYFSLMRQNVENANQIRTSDQMLDNGSFVKMVVSVLRVGGSSDAWLLIYALMFISATSGVVMAAVQGHVLPWSPQDPVEILQKCLPAANIDELTHLGYRERFEAINRDGARL